MVSEEAVAARYKFSNASKAAIDPHSIFRAHTTDWSGRRTAAAISITIMTLNPPSHIKKAKKNDNNNINNNSNNTIISMIANDRASDHHSTQNDIIARTQKVMTLNLTQ